MLRTVDDYALTPLSDYVLTTLDLLQPLRCADTVSIAWVAGFVRNVSGRYSYFIANVTFVVACLPI